MANIQINKRHSFTGHSSGIYELNSINDREFISAGGDGQIVRWNLETMDDGQVIAKVGAPVYAVCIDEDRALIGENSRAVHMISLDEAKPIRSVEIKSPIFAMERVDDKYLIGTGAGELLIFDLDLNFIQKLKLAAKSLRCMTQNETDLVLGYSDNVIRVLDKSSLEMRYEITGHSLSVFAIMFHSDSKELISTGRDAHIRIWDTFNHYEEIKSIPAHMFASNHLAFHPDQNFFASGSMDKTIKIWDGTTFALLKVIDKARHEGHLNSVNKLLWMAFDNLLVTCSDDRTIAVWDIKFE